MRPGVGHCTRLEDVKAFYNVERMLKNVYTYGDLECLAKKKKQNVASKLPSAPHAER